MHIKVLALAWFLALGMAPVLLAADESCCNDAPKACCDTPAMACCDPAAAPAGAACCNEHAKHGKPCCSEQKGCDMACCRGDAGCDMPCCKAPAASLDTVEILFALDPRPVRPGPQVAAWLDEQFAGARATRPQPTDH